MSILDGLIPVDKEKEESEQPTVIYTHKELAEACRAASPKAIEVLSEILRRWQIGDDKIKNADVIKAATVIIERGYGVAPQIVKVEASVTDETLAINPAYLDVNELRSLASLLRNAAAFPALERVEGSTSKREEVAVTIDGDTRTASGEGSGT